MTPRAPRSTRRWLALVAHLGAVPAVAWSALALASVAVSPSSASAQTRVVLLSDHDDLQVAAGVAVAGRDIELLASRAPTGELPLSHGVSAQARAVELGAVAAVWIEGEEICVVGPTGARLLRAPVPRPTGASRSDRDALAVVLVALLDELGDEQGLDDERLATRFAPIEDGVSLEEERRAAPRATNERTRLPSPPPSRPDVSPHPDPWAPETTSSGIMGGVDLVTSLSTHAPSTTLTVEPALAIGGTFGIRAGRVTYVALRVELGAILVLGQLEPVFAAGLEEGFRIPAGPAWFEIGVSTLVGHQGRGPEGALSNTALARIGGWIGAGLQLDRVHAIRMRLRNELGFVFGAPATYWPTLDVGIVWN